MRTLRGVVGNPGLDDVTALRIAVTVFSFPARVTRYTATLPPAVWSRARGARRQEGRSGAHWRFECIRARPARLHIGQDVRAVRRLDIAVGDLTATSDLRPARRREHYGALRSPGRVWRCGGWRRSRSWPRMWTFAARTARRSCARAPPSRALLFIPVESDSHGRRDTHGASLHR
jgi:hypothetical protein